MEDLVVENEQSTNKSEIVHWLINGIMDDGWSGDEDTLAFIFDLNQNIIYDAIEGLRDKTSNFNEMFSLYDVSWMNSKHMHRFYKEGFMFLIMLLDNRDLTPDFVAGTVSAFYNTKGLFTMRSVKDVYDEAFTNAFDSMFTANHDIKPEPGYVYLIQDGTGKIKIGKAKNLKVRIKNLQGMNSSHLELLKSYKVLEYSKLEKKLHDEFSKYNLHGEWFDIPVKILVKKSNEIAKQFEIEKEG